MAAVTCGPPGQLLSTDYQKNETYPLMKCIRRHVTCAEWAADHFGVDLKYVKYVNRSIFDEDMREKT